MERVYNLENHQIKVDLDPGIVRVYSNKALWDFLDAKASIRFECLVKTIKEDYASTYKKDLLISDNSLLVEILVHVHCDYLGLKFNRLVPFSWSRNLVKKLLKRAEIVDCGEKKLDGNRWFWDFLSGYKKTFIRLLPENLNAGQLKLH